MATEGKNRVGLYVMVILIFVMLFYIGILVERIACKVDARGDCSTTAPETQR